MKKPFDPLENDVARVLRKKRTVKKSLTVAKRKSAEVQYAVRIKGTHSNWLYVTSLAAAKREMTEILGAPLELVHVTVEPVRGKR